MTTAIKSSLAGIVGALGELVVRSDVADGSITGIAYDSRSVRPGSLFCCVPGTVRDGHEFAGQAIAAGAVALIVERPLGLATTEILVSDARRAMARAAAAFYDRPGDAMTLLGVTGTNGKTTTAYLLESILRASGRTTGLVGTVETRIAGRSIPGVRTTPESVDLQRLLFEMRNEGVEAVAMEVTSHALVLHRVEGLRFAASAFTNLSQDHLDFHRDLEDYFAAKRSLFVEERTAAAAVNIDDPYGRKLFENIDVPGTSFGTSPDADVRAGDIRFAPGGTSFTITSERGNLDVDSGLVGAFNVSNCLAAAATAMQAGVDNDAIREGISALRAVPGRFEAIDAGQPFTLVVDYAHTPDSLDNVLRAARGMAERTRGRVVCVFGCGGDRDKGKRPLMGAVTARLADVVIVTSDNPRSEDPRSIIDQILEGVIAERPGGADEANADRKEAIEYAIRSARAGDVVVVAGKGHETGQEFADRTIPFDDRVVARDLLVAAGYGGAA